MKIINKISMFAMAIGMLTFSKTVYAVPKDNTCPDWLFRAVSDKINSDWSKPMDYALVSGETEILKQVGEKDDKDLECSDSKNLVKIKALIANSDKDKKYGVVQLLAEFEKKQGKSLNENDFKGVNICASIYDYDQKRVDERLEKYLTDDSSVTIQPINILGVAGYKLKFKDNVIKFWTPNNAPYLGIYTDRDYKFDEILKIKNSVIAPSYGSCNIFA